MLGRSWSTGVRMPFLVQKEAASRVCFCPCYARDRTPHLRGCSPFPAFLLFRTQGVGGSPSACGHGCACTDLHGGSVGAGVRGGQGKAGDQLPTAQPCEDDVREEGSGGGREPPREAHTHTPCPRIGDPHRNPTERILTTRILFWGGGSCRWRCGLVGAPRTHMWTSWPQSTPQSLS